MRIYLRLNGALISQVGRDRLALEVPEGTSVTELIRQVETEYPGAAAAMDRAVSVVGGRVVDRTEPLTDGDEVALLLPISGG